jgi:excisionase family DNA binding protein
MWRLDINAVRRSTMPYTLAEAAKATGTNKTTVLRAIKSGKITGTKDEHGTWWVEPAELHRVYPPAELRTDAGSDATQRYAPATAAALDAQIAGVRTTAELLRSQLEDVRKDRDHWRDQAQRLVLPSPKSEKPMTWWQWLRSTG